MRVDIALITSITIFFLFFVHYYTVPPVITVLSSEDILKFVPEAYAHPSDMPEKIVFAVKHVRGYTAIEFWYYWPYDGVIKKDDWEPVIVYTDGEHVLAVAHREHYVWRVNYNPLVNNTHVVVMFQYGFHTPYIQQPFPGWERIRLPIMYEVPPKDVDVSKIVGWELSPTKSALYAAVMYSTLWSVLAYAVLAGVLGNRRFVRV